jgi:hypothetical protein
MQLAELHSAKGDKEAAKAELDEVLRDDMHAPAFQRKRDAGLDQTREASLKTL